MEKFNLFFASIFVLALAVFEIGGSEDITIGNQGAVPLHPAFNALDHQDNDGFNNEHSLQRHKRQSINNQPQPDTNENANDVDKPKPPPDYNPLEGLILNQDKTGFEPDASLSRVKRQYGRRYPYPTPILIGGGFGEFGGFGRGFGRGFGGRGFGGRGFGGRGFGGRGFGGGRGISGGIGGRGGIGGGRGGGSGRG